MTGEKFSAVFTYGFRQAWSYRINFLANYLSRFFIVIFYYYLGLLVKQAGLQEFEGGSYFAFVLVGGVFLKFLEFVITAFAENVHEQMLNGTLESLLATANPMPFVLLGPSSWKMAESSVLLVAQFLFGFLLGADFTKINVLSTLVVVVVSLLCVISFGIFAATFTVVYKRHEPVKWLSSSMFMVFSGVFFPIAILPPVFRFISYLFPFSYALEGLRGAMIQGKSISALTSALLPLAGFAIVLLPLSIVLLRAAIRRMRQTGGLVFY